MSTVLIGSAGSATAVSRRGAEEQRELQKIFLNLFSQFLCVSA